MDLMLGAPGRHWGGYFGLKAHIGVDSKTKLIHAAAAAAANVPASAILGDLLHGKETRIRGDFMGEMELRIALHFLRQSPLEFGS